VPYATVRIPLATTALQEVVRRSQRFNGVSVIHSPPGVEFFVKIGNNPRTGPYRGRPVWVFGSDVPAIDKSEGFWLQVDAVVPNGFIAFDISYQ
jgi:hypothetical protein